MEKCNLLKKHNDKYNEKIYSMFKKNIDSYIDKPAIIFKNNLILSYKDLKDKISSIAVKLKDFGISKGNIVGFMVKRRPEMIAIIFSILSLDCAYLPIDLNLPYDRVSYMLDNSEAKFLITEKDTKIKKEHEFEVDFPYNLKLVKFKEKNLKTYDYSELAYVIYTSGSTGKPKGVMVKESAVINFINAMEEIVDFKRCKNILASTTVIFDISVLELILPLVLGLTVVLADEVQQKDPNLLLDLITKNDIKMIQFTPSRMATLLIDKSNYTKLKNLNYILIGGEKFPEHLLKKLQSINNGIAKIFNMYGPTETTIWSTYKDLTNEKYISVGNPLKNTQVYIIDDNAKIVKKNKLLGEICIGGDGLALGYINNEELTDKKFIFLNEVSDYVYKTGDFGFWNKNNLECSGRMDFQIKINGYRVELEEIETVMVSHPYVREAVVVVSETDSNVFLKAYVTVSKKIKSGEIESFLKDKLPSYMVPSIIEEIDAMPLMVNGKIDRNKLKKLSERKPDIEIETKFENETQKKVAIIWSEVLGLKSLDINKNFFDYGGNSISLAMIESLINEKFKINISVLDLFEYTTIKQISEFIDNKDKLNSRRKVPNRLNIKKLKNLKN